MSCIEPLSLTSYLKFGSFKVSIMVAVQLIESPNIISLQTEINKFLEGIDNADLIDIKLTSPQKDSVTPPAKYAGQKRILSANHCITSRYLGNMLQHF